MKIAIFGLILVLFAPACSHKTENPAEIGKPQFTIAAADLAMPAEMATNGAGSGHETIVIHLQFSADKTDAFRKFTHEHINQQTQLVVGPKVVAEPFIISEITNGQADLAFSSVDEARTVADLLGKK